MKQAPSAIMLPFTSSNFVIPLLMCIAVAALYFSGLTGRFYYDDLRPLGNLSQVTDLTSSLYYLFTEISGVLGRPLSMLSFLLQANSWPENSSHFFIANIIIHSLNVLLVFIVSFFIINFYKVNNKKQNIPTFLLAISIAFFWGILPLHVSSSLIAIQRMTTLSGFFVLSGIALYLYGLTKQLNYTQTNKQIINSAGLTPQLLGLFLFTLLAMFSKENGILLPVFIFVLEVTLLSNIFEISHRRQLRTKATFLGLLVILLYLIFTVINNQGIYPNRDFTVVERLLTQSVILFDYLKLAFIPDIYAYNPFHDNTPIIKELTPFVIFSALFWLVGLITAITIRKKQPLLSFAFLWFVAAHLLESTVLNLELYYEHRNYIALLGPCLAIVLLIIQSPIKIKKIILLSFISYLALLSFSLYQTTTLWGNPEKAAQAWFLKQKGSVRAAEHLSGLYLENNQLPQAMSILDYQATACPTCISSIAQAMLIACEMNDKNKTLSYYHQLIVLSKTVRLVANTPEILSVVNKQMNNGFCTAISIEQLKTLNQSLLDVNDQSNDVKLKLIINLHQIAMGQDDKKEKLRLLKLAWQEKADPGLGQLIITHLIDNGKNTDAINFVNNELCKTHTTNYFKNNKIKESCIKAKERIKLLANSLSKVVIEQKD